jgi:hypothetical protein
MVNSDLAESVSQLCGFQIPFNYGLRIYLPWISDVSPIPNPVPWSAGSGDKADFYGLGIAIHGRGDHLAIL